jgi:hypothetical protein
MAEQTPQKAAREAELQAREDARLAETPKVEAKSAKAPYVRTKVRTTNPAKGVYRTLDGQFEIRANGKAWDLYRIAGSDEMLVEAGIKGWDRALDRALAVDGAELEALNTRPPKPAASAKAEAKPEAKEEGVNARRTGSTGAPRKTRPATEGVHVKRSRAVKVG